MNYWSFVCFHFEVAKSLAHCVCGELLIILLATLGILYLLDTSPLGAMCIVRILSHYVSCLFSFLMVSFDEQKCKILMKSKLSFFF